MRASSSTVQSDEHELNLVGGMVWRLAWAGRHRSGAGAGGRCADLACHRRMASARSARTRRAPAWRIGDVRPAMRPNPGW